MAVHKSTAVGEKAKLPFSTVFINDLVRMVNAYNRGEFGGEGRGGIGTGVVLTNKTGATIVARDAVAIKKPISIKAVNVDASSRRPALEVEAPVWHSNLASIVTLPNSLPNNQTKPYALPTWSTVNISGGTGPYAMPDPSDPKKFKLSTGGLGRVIAYDSTNSIAVVDFREAQNLWRYELTQAWQSGGTTAKLLDMAGVEFAANFTLMDPLAFMDDQVLGDPGFCLRVGNHFFAIQAPCKDPPP